MSLKMHELRDSVRNTIHVDEYKAKMGNDDDILVFSFKVSYRDQAEELVNFLEKGYDWILDADVSSGEMEDGGFLVFIECERRPSLTNKILTMLEDLHNVTDLDPKTFKFVYKDGKDYIPLTAEMFDKIVPLSPRAYRAENGDASVDEAINAMKNVAGIKIVNNAEYDEEIKRFVNLSKR